jgi:hypothetical protein
MRFVVACIRCAFLVGCSRRENDKPRKPERQAITYDSLRRALPNAANDPGPAESLGFHIKAYNWTRDVAVDRNLLQHLLAVSQMWGSQLLLFASSGRLQFRLDTQSELHSIELFDFDSDGTTEIITVQMTDHGTGYLREEFVIYSVAGGTIREIWRAVSHEYQTEPLAGDVEHQTDGYIRPEFEHLFYDTYDTRKQTHSSRHQEFEFMNGTFSFAKAVSERNAGDDGG